MLLEEDAKQYDTFVFTVNCHVATGMINPSNAKQNDAS